MSSFTQTQNTAKTQLQKQSASLQVSLKERARATSMKSPLWLLAMKSISLYNSRSKVRLYGPACLIVMYPTQTFWSHWKVSRLKWDLHRNAILWIRDYRVHRMILSPGLMHLFNSIRKKRPFLCRISTLRETMGELCGLSIVLSVKIHSPLKSK